MYNDLILSTWGLMICAEQQPWQKATWMQLLLWESRNYSSRSLELFIILRESKICFGTLFLRLFFILVIEFLPHWKSILHFKKPFATSFLVVCLHFVFQSLWWHLGRDLIKRFGTVLLTKVDVVQVYSVLLVFLKPVSAI